MPALSPYPAGLPVMAATRAHGAGGLASRFRYRRGSTASQTDELQALFRASPIGISRCDFSGRVLDANAQTRPASAAAIGFDPYANCSRNPATLATAPRLALRRRVYRASISGLAPSYTSGPKD
jgi:hypothetical protein